MGKGDHIVIPKSILRRFTDKNNKITCLYVKNFLIKKKNLDSIFTEKNYYYDEIDKFIKDNDESVIGILYKAISEGRIKDFEIEMKYIESMRYIFFIQHFRNNTFSNTLEAKVKKIDKKTIHNISIASLINYLKNGKAESEFMQEIYDDMEKEFKNYTPGSIILNNTNRTFLLPASQFVYCFLRKTEAYIYPIAPDIALIWRKNSNKKFEYGMTSDDKLVEEINKLIIDSELSIKADYLVFGEEEEITRINQFKKNNKN